MTVLTDSGNTTRSFEIPKPAPSLFSRDSTVEAPEVKEEVVAAPKPGPRSKPVTKPTPVVASSGPKPGPHPSRKKD